MLGWLTKWKRYINDDVPKVRGRPRKHCGSKPSIGAAVCGRRPCICAETAHCWHEQAAETAAGGASESTSPSKFGGGGGGGFPKPWCVLNRVAHLHP